jgi:hypothetical protein
MIVEIWKVMMMGLIWKLEVFQGKVTRILAEIVVGISAEHGCGDSMISLFVREMIAKGKSASLKGIESFHGSCRR